METRSGRRRRMRLDQLAAIETEDRFSSLPSPLIHNIISRLPSRASSRMSILSKKWLYLVDTLRCVNFELNEFCDGPENVLHSKIDDFVRRYVSRLNYHVLQKVRFSSQCPLHSKVDYHLGKCIALGVRGRIQELDLCFRCDTDSWCVCCWLPRRIFKSQLHVTVLRLEGFRIWEHKFAGFPVLKTLSLAYLHIDSRTLSVMVSTCPILESLTLECCWELENVSVTSCSLRRLTISHCIDVKFVYMDLPMLCTFEYDLSEQGKETNPLGLFRTTEFQTAKDVKLVNVEVLYLSYLMVDFKTLKHIFAIFPNLIDLRIKGCVVEFQPHVFPVNLKKLIVVEVFTPELIEGFATSVEDLYCDSTAKWFSYVLYSPVNFVCLKSVTLAGLFLLSDEALERLISSCPRLEILNLLKCVCFKHIKTHSHVLKVVTIMANCDYLESAEIEAPNLVSFEYDGPFIVFSKNIFSPALFGRLSFTKCPKYPNGPQLHLLEDVAETFKNASRLTLDAQASELIWLSDARKRPLPCWFKLDHLKVKSEKSFICHNEVLDLLVISQCCNVMSIELSSSSVQFKFADSAGADAVAFNVGDIDDYVGDHLIEVSFNDFECNSHEVLLVKYLLLKAKKLKQLAIWMKPGVTEDNASVREALNSIRDIHRTSGLMICSVPI